MKIVFFNRFFHPDSSATSQILSDLAFHLARSGAEVHVVTSAVPNGTAPLETIHGVTAHRVAAANTGPHGLAARAFAYAGYYLGARRAARALLRAGDIAVVKTDPPMLSAALAGIAARNGARVIVWSHDIFPEVAREYGVPGMKGALGRWLARKRNDSFAHAQAVVAIGERMGARLVELGAPRDRVRVIHNWADGEAIRPLPREGNAMRARWNLDPAFVAGYSGNLGRVHEFDTLLGAAALLRGDAGIRFLIVGRGPRLAEVRERAARERLDNVVFHDHQDRASLSESLAVPDVHIAILDRRFDGLVLPSKLYGIMAAGRPVIFVGDTHGESAALVQDARCGSSVATGDAQGLADAIRGLRDHPADCAELGGRARAAFDAKYAMEKAFERWRAVLAEAGYKGS